MPAIEMGIVGCGGMGGRHLLGLKELHETGLGNVELVAACDLREDNARHLADRAEELLGRRPLVFASIEAMATALPGLQGVAITTDAGSHHGLACAALELGLNVLCEKPLALTVRGCNLIIEAVERSGKVLSVAENYRRDPLLRLTKELLDAGIIGRPYMMLSINCGGGDGIFITPWRHYKEMGGILIDMGVHYADLMHYYLGDVREACGTTRLYERIRHKPEESSRLSPFYQRWHQEMPEEIEATAEDALVSVLTFESGVVGQWTSFHAAHGEGFEHSVIYGSQGSLRPAEPRSGRGPVLHLDGRGEVAGDAILDLVPDFHLDELYARLYGENRLVSYELSFPEADRKLLAMEYHEFAECVLESKAPEVDAYGGRKALALVYAVLESSMLNRPVGLAEIETEKTGAYEAEINQRVGI